MNMEEFNNTPIRHDLKWYALRTFTSHEARVKASIEQELVRLGIEEKVRTIIIPQETVYEVRILPCPHNCEHFEMRE